MKSKSKKIRRLRPPLINVAKSMGKWKASDDYLLIQAVTQLSCLDAVHKCTQFSIKFSLKEIQERWYAILYDAPISKMIYKKLESLKPDEIEKLKSLAPFSDTENEILMNIESTKNPSLDEFGNILVENRVNFYESRNASTLKQQWLQLNHFRLLNDQHAIDGEDSDAAAATSKLVRTFEDNERTLEDIEIMNNVNLNDEIEEVMCQNYKKIINQIKRSEAELYLWQVLVDKATKKENDFENIECLAILESENFKYIMKSREISMGRSTPKSTVDLDFQLIGSDKAKKISRNQGAIKMNESGEFFLYNYSKQAIFVDGKIVLESCKTQLFDKSIIQLDDFSLLFFINFNVVAPIIENSKSLNEHLT